VACIITVAGTGTAAPTYSIVPLGLNDPEHTRNDGYQYNFADELNEAGQVTGTSYRYNGGSSLLGYSAWLYNGTTTARIGLTGPEHTRNDDYKISLVGRLTETGQVVGYSNRYNGGSTQLGQSVWFYDGANTIDIGLTGSDHTFINGYKWSEAFELTESGQVIGRSNRYTFIGDVPVVGYSAWIYDGATTVEVGFTGVEHTRNDGKKESYPYDLNESGLVIGISQRYSGSSTFGSSAWLYDGSSTIDIGLTGADYTADNGSKSSFVAELNEAGQVVGGSRRYNGGSFFANLGNTAWLYVGGARTEIGLMDNEHTNSSGYQSNFTEQLNEAGQVSGYAYLYNGGNTQLGQSAWLYDGTNTVHIGLTGAEHTRNDGYRYNSVSELHEAGTVLGYTNRYNGGSTEMGRSIWLYDGVTTVHLGLTGAEHTQNDGYKNSSASQVNEAGQVVGFSTRYNSGISNGVSAWLYNGTTTVNIGLTGAEYTRNDGYKVSFPSNLNASGQAIGKSDRYNGGSTPKGESIWLYNGTSTINVGLAGSEHTRSDGYKISFAIDLNEAGQVIGRSYRYNGSSSLMGWDGWIYDPVLDQTFTLNTSTRSDGFAYSTPHFLGEDGLVLGTHTLYDALDNGVESAFYFTVADGLQELGPLVAGGLPANGWESLADAVRRNRLGQLLGYGKLTSQSAGQMAYLLTPVPEPSGAMLLMAAAFALAGPGARRSKRGSSALR
jgi:hypothetical protein